MPHYKTYEELNLSLKEQGCLWSSIISKRVTEPIKNKKISDQVSTIKHMSKRLREIWILNIG